MQDAIDTAEEDILRGPSAFSPETLMRLRRDLLTLRKSLFHEREILVKVCRRDSPYVSEKAIYHFRDIYDHLASTRSWRFHGSSSRASWRCTSR